MGCYFVCHFTCVVTYSSSRLAERLVKHELKIMSFKRTKMLKVCFLVCVKRKKKVSFK